MRGFRSEASKSSSPKVDTRAPEVSWSLSTEVRGELAGAGHWAVRSKGRGKWEPWALL